ncbi:hypothetical protein [Pseudomonas putida]|uniref:hypothetical protein n=1 Tax=Pseudomonas putida TaxID=303 RepID=UPI000A789A53|nr:hypothetical protein [Pseudomonas putida]
MARKQETQAPTTDAKDPVSGVDSNSDPSEAAGSPLSPGGALVSDTGDSGSSGAPAAAPWPAGGSGLVTPELQAAPGTGTDAVTGEQGTSSGIFAVDAAAFESSGKATSDLADSGNGADKLAAVDQAKSNPNPATLEIYPLRSYIDEGELRRRGGPAYSVPRRHAEELVERKLASLEPLKE